jgi:hypothetical protein
MSANDPTNGATPDYHNPACRHQISPQHAQNISTNNAAYLTVRVTMLDQPPNDVAKTFSRVFETSNVSKPGGNWHGAIASAPYLIDTDMVSVTRIRAKRDMLKPN